MIGPEPSNAPRCLWCHTAIDDGHRRDRCQEFYEAEKEHKEHKAAMMQLEYGRFGKDSG